MPGSWIILSATPSMTSKKCKALDEPIIAAALPTKKTAGSTQSREHRIENEVTTCYSENTEINSTVDMDWRMLSDKDYEMLLVWRHTDSFKMPKNKADCPKNLEKSSDKDKTAICWQDWFIAMLKKFTISVTNHISYLCKMFISHYHSLHQTGEGVQAGVDAANIYVVILKDFPWYDDLYAIWNGIPNFTAKLTNLQPGKSHNGMPHPTAIPPDKDISMWDGDELDEGVGMDKEEVVSSKVVNQGVAQKGKRKNKHQTITSAKPVSNSCILHFIASKWITQPYYLSDIIWHHVQFIQQQQRSDGIGSHRLAISMEKNHCLVIKMKHIDDE
ncbi:hypothetical protein HD554DRAFT_2041171 [Boletus coccyginus]|nr:hypothetical protein HD554DRAFT_2041171 [Boletus coccyginus]